MAKRRRKQKKTKKNKPEPKRRLLAKMSTTTTIIICTLVPTLVGVWLSFYSHKPWILYFPLFGVLLLLGYLGHLWIRSYNATFSVTAEVHIAAMDRNHPGYGLLFERDNGIMAAAITDLFYIRFTNTDSSPVLIDYYAIEVREEGKDWQAATSLDRVNGQLFMMAGERTANMSLEDPKFIDVIANKTIGAGDSIRGVLLVERPEGLDAPKKKEWRFRMRDVNGREGAAAMTEPVPKSFKQTLTNLRLKMGENIDMTGVTRVFYSDLVKKADAK